MLAASLLFGGVQQGFAAAGDGTLTLRLFEDVGRDGQYQSTVDTLVSGVTVRAFDNDGDSVTATDAAGVYTISFGSQPSMNGGKYRIEIDASTLPGSVDPSSLAGGSRSFTEVVNVAGNTAVTLLVPVAVPKNACVVQGDLDMVVSTYVAGGHTDNNSYNNLTGDGGGSVTVPATAPAIVSFPVSAMGSTPVAQSRTLATFGQVGATGGLAVQQSRGRVYAAALARRHVDYGPGGAGAIYAVDITGAGVVDTFTIPNAGNTQRAVDATNSTNNGHPVFGWIRDSLMFDRVGKEAFGDIEIDAAETTLWAVNLNDRHLYSVNIDTLSPGYGTVTDLGLLSATIQGDADNFRPYALKFHNGALFLGATASGQIHPTSPTIDDVSYHVYRFTDPYNGVAMTEIYSSRVSPTDGGLEYFRGNSVINWHPWATTWDTAYQGNLPGYPWASCHPQPILSDIEFDSNNNMILGFRDRWGDQIGINTQSPGSGTPQDPASNVGFYETVSMGEILHHCWSPNAGATGPENAVLGDWEAETTCGELENDPNDGVNVTEHYHRTSFTGVHPETAQGSLATHPLFPNTIFTTSQDPFALRSGGIHRFHTVDNGANDAGSSPFQNGSGAGGYGIFDGQSSNGIGLPGKSNGLGDVEFLCALSPLQMGNLVWYDEDGDGIHDPLEVPIPGVEVKLYTDLNNDTVLDLIDTVTTDFEGRYFFYADPDRTYTITVDPTTAPDFNDSSSNLIDTALLAPTTPNQSSGGGNDLNDSEVDGQFGGIPSFNVSTSANRVSNHALDAGFVVETVAIGNLVWLDDGAGGGVRDNGIIDGTEAGIDGVRVELYRTGVDTIGTPFLFTTTAGGGFYLFDEIPQDDYFVHIPASNFAGVLNGLSSSTGAGGDDTNDDNADENGQDALVSGGVSSVSIALFADTLPTIEPGQGTYGGALDDDNVNLTVDFGFVPPILYDLGDLPDTGAGTGADNYQTLLSDSGARHELGSGLILGAVVDDEADGQPNASATGDDTNPPTNDDEDGVSIPSLTAGSSANVQVTVAGAPSGAQVNAFFDWNDDGDFGDPGEAIPQLAVSNGANTLNVPVPLNAVTTSLIGVRIRLSSAGGLTPIGDAPDGEVEDYMVSVTPAYDLGDLPDTGAGTSSGNYRTLLSDSGARHQLGTGLLLGAVVDAETDGQPNGTATGDGADEDGVTFPSFSAGSSANVSITVAGAPGGAAVNAFFDWNADGDFADAGEVIPELAVVNGPNVLSVPVPLSAVPGTDLGVRIRLSNAGGLTSTGDADDGEVEDYLVQVSPVSDFGDLPDNGAGTGPGNYQTFAGDAGPSHRLGSGLLLGGIVDDEADGQPSTNADGDDTTGGSDDEDGVFIPTLTAGQPATLQITVGGINGTSPAILNAFIDWNGDGDFNDPDETLPPTPVFNGTAPLNVMVPLGAETDEPIGLRFRLSSQGGLSPTGPALDGEVEDYLASVTPVYDFGDAPALYGTFLIDNGARHQIVPGIYLGALVDPEATGFPSVDSLGDDLIPPQGDDEDGIEFLDPVVAGLTVRVQVTASTNGILNAWMDFDGNLAFDPGEAVFTEAPVPAGVSIQTVAIPISVATGNLYSRFRFTTLANEGDSPQGLAANGEVEDYLVQVVPVDLGDLPTAAQSGFGTSYPTTLADSGAVHQIESGVFLGASVDAETNGVPSVGADGDDLALSPDDEDGVAFLSPVIPGLILEMEITASDDGFLNAWFDWNGNGVLTDPGEHVAIEVPLVGGVNPLNVPIPSTLGATNIYSRFRFTTGQGEALFPTGFANNGEVEDYVLPVADLEFGDLPDVYGTLFASGGAAHIYNSTFFLGTTLDVEADGAPSSGADGDDTTGNDDEDGVTFVSALIGGTVADVDVEANEDGFLNAWYDFNGDGDFADPGEYVFADVPLTAGMNNLFVNVPLNVADQVYIRFRFTENQGEATSPTGIAVSGEVEDYVQPGINYDYGDLPDDEEGGIYPTLLSNNGARHQIVPGVYLGALVDAEGDGQPSTGADGDDVTPPTADDEDGVVVSDYLVPGYTTDIVVTASTNGFLNAWFDFNDNGSLADPGEHVFQDVVLVPGGNTLPVAVPPGATPGDLYSRFRFTLAGSQATDPTGAAPSGEVEDYLLTISAPVNLGNLVWNDTNNNGAVDPGETGIDGVLVELHTNVGPPGPGNLVATDTTSGGGLYNFDNLYPGTYVVTIPTAPADAPRSSEPTDTADNGEDNDDNGTQATTGGLTVSPEITLTPGGEPDSPTDTDGTNGDLTVDFGFYEPLSLGNIVWFDGDNSGTINGAEAGIDGVTVELFLSSQTPGVDAPIASDTTAGGGYYLFDNLTPGDYVVFIPPANFTGVLTDHVSSTPTEATPNSDADSNDNGIDDPTPAVLGIASGLVTLAPNAEPAGEADIGPEGNGIADANSSNLTVDFGFYIPVAIGNLVWHDANNNGLRDGGETPLGGVLVELYRSTQTPGVDAPLATDTTDPSGLYGFDGLVPGDYIVSIPTPPVGYPRSSTVTDTADNREDNDDNGTQSADGARTTSPVINLASGAEPNGTDGDNANGDLTIDFGFFAPVNLGNLVWNDVNNNGAVDPGEPGIDGVEVRLFSAGQDPLVNAPVATDTTSGGGFYEFTGLNPGLYFVYIPTPPAAAPRSSDVTDTADNGQDNDDNGSQTATGDPVTSPVVTLVSNGEPDSPTDGDGNNGDLTVDFGFYQPVNLGNLVWNDANNNGLVDSGESAIPGVTVELYAAGLTPGVDAPTATDTTDGSGLYNFDDLPPGVYVVSIPTPPASFPRSSDVTDTDDNGQDNDDNGTQASTGARTTSPAITLLAGTEPVVGVDGDGTNGDLTIDFGFYQPVNLGNLVWNDRNDNGLVDPGEPGIGAVIVELYRAGDIPGTDAPVTSQPTNGSGNYNFTDLPPGDYIVSIPTPPSSAPKSSTTTDPADNGQDNDDNGSQPGGTGTRTTSPVITLLSPTEPSDDGDGAAGDLTVDLGFFIPVNLGNLVWHDLDGDGFKDAAEPGIPDVTVELYLATQTPGVDSPIATDITDPDGLYNFADLSPGQYIVYIPVAPPATPASSPAGVTDTADNGEDLDDNGSQPGGTGTPVTSPVITLLAGTEPIGDGDDNNGDLTVDFGFYTPVRVGDLVWNDLDGDGRQNPEEPGVTNVVVTLINNTTSAVVSNLTTDANGEYLFTDLPPGDYFVTFELPPGFRYTVPNSTNATDSTDSDAGVYEAEGVGSTPPTGFLFSGQEDLTLDAGAYEPATLGDTVWIDVTRDGTPDDENLLALGIPGVTVDLLRILDGATNTVGSATTSTNTTNRGYYVFTNLPPGTYVVRVDTNTVPTGYPTPTTPIEYLTILASGDDSDGEDFGFITETTAIELKSLAATEVSGGVRVAWETSSEKDNFGFLVYRSDRLNGNRTLVSPALIEGQGTGSGASYSFTDVGVASGRYFYWLEDLDYDGTRTFHGPAAVVVDGSSAASEHSGLEPVFVPGAANVAVNGEVTASVEVEGGLVVVVPAGAAVTPAAGAALRLAAVAAAPSEGVEAAMSLAADDVAVVTATAGTNLLVGGFTSAPVAVLVSAEGSVVLEGAVLETEAGFALYLSVPADGEVVLFAK